MKLFLKVVKITLLILTAFLGILLLGGWLLQDRITDYALGEIRNTLDTPLDIEKARFSLVSDFPSASVKFDGFWLGSYINNDVESGVAIDTLARVSHLFLSLNLFDLFNDEFHIEKVELEDGFINYYIDKDGVSGFDAFVTTDTTTQKDAGQSIDLVAKDIVLSNIEVHYLDQNQNTEAKIVIPEIKGVVQSIEPDLHAQLSGKLIASDLNLDGTNLNRMQKADLDLDISIKADTLQIAKVSATTDELSFTSAGKLTLGESMYTDLDIGIEANQIGSLIKYIPNEMLSDYPISQVSGKMAITAKIQGLIKENELPHYEFDFGLSNGNLKWQNYPIIYNIGLAVRGTNGESNNNVTTTIDIDKFRAEMSGNEFQLNGTINNLDDINFKLKSALNIDLNASNELIPDSLNLKLGGNIRANMTTEGSVPDTVNKKFVNAMLKSTRAQVYLDNVEIDQENDLVIQNLSARMEYKNRKIKVDSLGLSYPEYNFDLYKSRFKIVVSGNVLKPKSTTIKVPEYFFKSKEGTVRGSATIKKLKNVTFSLRSKLDLRLKRYREFLPDSLVSNIRGRAIASMRLGGKFNLDKIDTQLEPLIYNQSELDIRLKNLNIDMKDTLMSISDLNGRISKKEDIISLSKLTANYQGIDLNVEECSIRNAIKTAIQNKPGKLKVDCSLRFGDLDYSVLGALAGSQESDNQNSSKTEDPVWNYDIRGKVFVNSFRYDDAMIRDISTTFNMNNITNLINGNLTVSNLNYDNTLINGMSSKYQVDPGSGMIKGRLAINDMYYEDAVLNNISALYNVSDTVVTVDNMRCQAFNGKIKTSTKLIFHSNDQIEIEMKNDIDHIDMRRLMSEMKDFDQKEITHKNFSGQLTSDNMFLQLVMVGDSVVYDKLRMTADLKFENGGIYNYAPVQEMATYLPKVDNLDTMLFKTIETHLFVFKDAIYVPSTYVATSAFDVEALGQQSFGEDFQYHVGINLFQVLGKNKKFDAEDQGPIKEKNMVRRLVTGRDGNYFNENSNGKKRDDTRKDMQTKERLLKFKFHPELFDFNTGAEGI